MDHTGIDSACMMVVGIMAAIGLANLVDYQVRTIAEQKARRAESARVRRWGLPAPNRPEPPRNDEHLWHF